MIKTAVTYWPPQTGLEDSAPVCYSGVIIVGAGQYGFPRWATLREGGVIVEGVHQEMPNSGVKYIRELSELTDIRNLQKVLVAVCTDENGE